MHGRDLPILDADALVHVFDNRRQAVCGAGRGRQQLVPFPIVKMVIDADHDGERAVILDGSGHDHALHTLIEVRLQLLELQEFAGTFENDLAPKIAPGHVAFMRSLLKRCREKCHRIEQDGQ